jgi:hypothetical protein
MEFFPRIFEAACSNPKAKGGRQDATELFVEFVFGYGSAGGICTLPQKLPKNGRNI